MDLLQLIPADWLVIIQAVLAFLGAAVTFASVIVPRTKTPKDDEALALVKNVLIRFSLFPPKK